MPRCEREHADRMSLLGVIRRLDALGMRLSVDGRIPEDHAVFRALEEPWRTSRCKREHTDELDLPHLLVWLERIGFTIVADPEIPDDVVMLRLVDKLHAPGEAAEVVR